MTNTEAKLVIVLIGMTALCVWAALNTRLHDTESRLNTKIQELETKIDMLKRK